MAKTKKPPKEDEQIAADFLRRCVHPNVEYEPLGRDTNPDFLVDTRIAVEVRRLNQNLVSDDGQKKGLDDESIQRSLYNLVTSFPAPSQWPELASKHPFSSPYRFETIASKDSPSSQGFHQSALADSLQHKFKPHFPHFATSCRAGASDVLRYGVVGEF